MPYRDEPIPPALEPATSETDDQVDWAYETPMPAVRRELSTSNPPYILTISPALARRREELEASNVVIEVPPPLTHVSGRTGLLIAAAAGVVAAAAVAVFACLAVFAGFVLLH